MSKKIPFALLLRILKSLRIGYRVKLQNIVGSKKSLIHFNDILVSVYIGIFRLHENLHNKIKRKSIFLMKMEKYLTPYIYVS